MGFKEIVNEFFGSAWFQELITFFQGALMIIATALLTRARNKIANNSLNYDDTLSDLRKSFGVTEEEVKQNKEEMKKYRESLDQSKQTEAILAKIIGMFLMDSKAIHENIKLEVGKLIGQLPDKEVEKEVTKVVEQAKTDNQLTAEQVEEIKDEVQVVTDKSNTDVEGITQQTLEVYEAINNDQ